MLKKFICAIAMVLLANLGFGQTVKVEIIFDEVIWSDYKGDGYGPMIRLYRNQWKDQYPYLLTSPCIKGRDYGQTGSSGDIYPGRVVSFNLNQSSPTENLIFVTHEERRAGTPDCTYETGTFGSDDKYQTKSEVALDLND